MRASGDDSPRPAAHTRGEAAERAVARLARLHAITAELAQALSLDRVAEAVIDHGVDILAASSGAIYVVDGGEARLLRAVGYPEVARERYARLPLAREIPICDAILSAEPVYLQSREEYAARYPASESRSRAVPQPAQTAIACLPLVADGRARGALALVFDDARPFDRDERGFLELLAHHCAQALERARLYRASEEALARAEEAHRETAALYRLSAAFARSATLASLYEEALSAIVRELGLERASILLFDAGGTMRFVAHRGLSEGYRRAVDGHSPWTRDARDPQPMFVDDVERDAALAAYLPTFRAERIAALAFVPLVHDGELIGKFMLYAGGPRAWSERDRRLARAFADLCAQAITRARLDEAKRLSERRYRSLVEALTSVVWTAGAAGELVAPQPAWEAYTGQPWERHRGAGWVEAVHPADRDELVRGWRDAVAAGRAHSASLRVWHAASAGWRHVEWRAVPIDGADGEIVEWVGKLLDVHEREEAVRRLAVLARSSEELARASLDVPQIFAALERAVAGALGGARPVRVAASDAELPADLGVRVPMRVEGRAAGVVGVGGSAPEAADLLLVQELADRGALAVATARGYQRAEALRAQLAAVMDAVPALMAFIDRDERYQMVSRSCESWFRMPREACIGRPVREVLGEAAHAKVAPHLAAALAGTRVEFEDEVPYRGGARHVHATYTPTRDASGAVTGIAGMVVDVTYLKRTAHFSEVIAAVLAHDLRNPLGAIDMAAQLLRRRGVGDELERPVGRILDSAARMSRMIDQLLDLTRIRLGGGLPLRHATVDLAALCRGVIDEIETGQGAGNVELEARGETVGRWDGDRLAQLLGNLVGNATAHREGTAPVRVIVDGSRGDELTVSVGNHGVIPPEVLEHIFEPFRRGAPRGERASGLGLGLYISREVVAAHGGSISVTSNQHHGTTFVVTLPRDAERGRRAGVA
jgi:PAS domain S-box-containing protein